LLHKDWDMNKLRPHILLVDDEISIREPLSKYLELQGYRVTAANDAEVARTALKSFDIDLALLDIMMPGEDGLSLCRFIAANNGPPVILLTAKSDETDRIIGLEIGADDYLTKPFSPRELVARIKVVLRRTGSSINPLASTDTSSGVEITNGEAVKPGKIFSFAGWTLKCNEQSLYDPAGVLIPLSTGEYRMLEALVSRPGQVLNRDHLLDLTRGREGGPFDRAIDNQISRLRRKIEVDPKNPQHIKTIWGGGYRFSTPVIRK
jgi:two-component system, OmpR family, response regulator